MLISGYYEKTLIKDQKTGYTIFSLKPIGSTLDFINIYGNVTCKGITPPIYVSEYISMECVVKSSDRGKYLEVKKILSEYKTDTAAIRFLSSEYIGLSVEDAGSLIIEYGTDIYRWITSADSIIKVCSVIPVSQKQAAAIVNAVANSLYWKKILDYSIKRGIGYDALSRLVSEYGRGAIKKICSEPYELENYGVSFETCDAIAIENGGSLYNRNRIISLLKQVLTAAEKDGDIFLPYDELYSRSKEKLMVISDTILPPSLYKTSVRSNPYLVTDGTDDIRVYLSRAYNDEVNIAKQLMRLRNTAKPLPYTPRVGEIAERICGVRLSDEQKNAIGILKCRGIGIITGGPGTGKTTVMRVIIAAFKQMVPYGEIKLCAPSGRAARRLAESTGMEATTIHRLLDYIPGDNGESKHKDMSDPIPANLIIVDEGSMIDQSLASILLSAVKSGAFILISGDMDQIKSVGAGDFFGECISSGCLPVMQLKQVFRQNEGSSIIRNANAINTGNSRLVEADDFKIIKAEQLHITETVCTITSKLHCKQDPFRLQILCPMNKGKGGTIEINQRMQAILNPNPRNSIVYGENRFLTGDKVIFTKNRPNKGYSNGDLGIILEILGNEITIDMNGTIIHLPRDNLDELQLAYAITVHRAQGSEFQNVIISLPKSGMLKRNILYTAVTRAKQSVILIGSQGSIELAVSNSDEGKRRTTLARRIKEELNKNAG
ncbi:MAG: AAA family ATPase [Ruminiclostridium sp.]|nr:AAA family ATPase [Ruminiclostridium sp.]